MDPKNKLQKTGTYARRHTFAVALARSEVSSGYRTLAGNDDRTGLQESTRKPVTAQRVLKMQSLDL